MSDHSLLDRLDAEYRAHCAEIDARNRAKHQADMAQNEALNKLALTSLAEFHYLTTPQLVMLFGLPKSTTSSSKVTRRMRRLAKQGLVQLYWKRSLAPDALPPVWHLTTKGAAKIGPGTKRFRPVRKVGGVPVEKPPRMHTIHSHTLAIMYRMGKLKFCLPEGAKIEVFSELQIIYGQRELRETLWGSTGHQLPDVYILVNKDPRQSIWIEVEQSPRSRPNLEKLADWWVGIGHGKQAKTLLMIKTGAEVGRIGLRLKTYMEQTKFYGWEEASAAVRVGEFKG